MNKRPIAMFALTAALLSATPASAEWMFARWGMTPEQLKAANDAGDGFVPFSRFAFVTEDPASTPDSRILAVAEAGPDETSQPLRARFGFDSSNRLNRVLVEPTVPEQCAEIHGQFLGLYGQPAPRDRGEMPDVLRWRRLRTVDIELRIVGGLAAPRGCSIDYRTAGALP